MPEDKPDARQSPPDPFRAGHAGYVTMVENFEGYRRAGSSWLTAIGLQAAMLVAGHIINSGEGDGQQ